MKKDGRDPQDALFPGVVAYTGLRNSEITPKTALKVWDEFSKVH